MMRLPPHVGRPVGKQSPDVFEQEEKQKQVMRSEVSSPDMVAPGCSGCCLG